MGGGAGGGGNNGFQTVIQDNWQFSVRLRVHLRVDTASRYAIFLISDGDEEEEEEEGVFFFVFSVHSQKDIISAAYGSGPGRERGGQAWLNAPSSQQSEEARDSLLPTFVSKKAHDDIG